MRNTPLLLQLLFWYNAVLKTLPGPRQSLSLGGLVLLNNRGLYLPRPQFGAGALLVAAALALAIVGALAFAVWARRRQALTRRARAGRARRARSLVVGLPTLAYFAAGEPIGFSLARLSGFNLNGGLQLFPEFAALMFGLVTYTAGFIAEIVRAGRAGGAARPERGGGGARAASLGRRCSSSSCRRRCASSFRR